MQTRSKTRALESTASLRNKQDTNGTKHLDWDSVNIKCLEFDPVKRVYLVTVKWPSGEETRHQRDELYSNSPQKV